MHAVLPGLGYGAKLNMRCEVLKTELFFFFLSKYKQTLLKPWVPCANSLVSM